MLIAAILTTAIAVDTAALYREAFTGLQHLDQLHKLRLYLHNGMPPGPQVQALFNETAAQRAVLHRAAAQESIDWGLDYSQGPGLLLPELSPVRAGARLLETTMLLHASAGDAEQASRAFRTMARMADHITEQELLISSLVAMSCIEQADASVERLIEMGMVDAELAGLLAVDYKRLNSADPFRLNMAIEREGEVMLQWVVRLGQSKDIEELDSAAQSVGFSSNRFGRALLQAAVPKAREAYDALLATTMLDDEDEMLAAMEVIEEKASQGVYGPLGSVLLPSMSHCFTYRRDHMKKFNERRDTLLKIASGELQPWALASRPWLWLLTARRVQDVDQWWTHAELAKDIDLQLLHAMGASKGVYPDPWASPDAAIPWWLPGQWKLLEGLIARALLHLDESRYSAALVDVQVAMDMTAVLAQDGRASAALTAADALPMLADLVDRLITAGQDVSVLAASVRQLPPARDAAGLIRSARSSSARLVQWHAEYETQHAQWEQMRSQVDNQGDWPEPVRRPHIVSMSDAAGMVAQLAAVRAVIELEEYVTLEPEGIFSGSAPPGLTLEVIKAAVDAAIAAPSPADTFTIPFAPIDSTGAALATARLRKAVL